MRYAIMAAAVLVITGALLIIFRMTWKKSKRTQRLLVAFVGSILFVRILFIFPFENLFYQWNSPESLFHYMNLRPMEYILEGKNSCMVVYRSSQTGYSDSFLEKRDGKYLIPKNSGVERIASQVIHRGSLFISKFGEDYYVSGLTILSPNSKTDISDNLSSIFKSRETVQVDGQRTVHFSAYLADFNYEYSITVGEETTDIMFAS